MSLTAPAASSLMTRLRTSFAQTAQISPFDHAAPAVVNPSTPISTVVEPPTDVNQLVELDSATKLDLFDQVLTEVEQEATQRQQSVAQAVPAFIQQATDTLNQPTYTGQSAKESVTSNQLAPEAGLGIQMVEEEKTPELPVEVEGYLEHVAQHQEQLPQEIVVAGDTVTQVPMPAFPTQPVVVLPITPEVEAEGIKKNQNWSIRWLVEFSHKIIKMFTGQVIYRTP